jgi:uncharacterized linocin/CFP29 family protein
MREVPVITAGATHIDWVGADGSPHGSIAQRLLNSGFNVNTLRTNTVLQKDEWLQLDTALLEVARQRLTGVNDLMSRGLRYGLQNALGVTRLEWERVSDMTAASVDMSGLTESENDRVVYDLVGMPIPIIHKDFHINIRALMASRNRGEGVDVTQVSLAGRLVAEKIEDLLFNGGFQASTLSQVYGYTTAPNRNTGTSGAWATPGTAGSVFLADTIAMIAALTADRMFGPYVMYVPAAVYINMLNDFKAETGLSILQRLLQIPQIADIRPSDNLTGKNILLVQMTRDVVDMVDGIQPMVIQWETMGGMMLNFKVLAIMVPRIKADQDLNSGIAHFS